MSAHASETMNIKLIVWRQAGPNAPGRFENYEVKCTPHHSFLEMLDVCNEDLIKAGKEPIVFDHDCREGICGMCSAVVNGVPHGGQKRTTLCQLHMRKFKDGAAIPIPKPADDYAMDAAECIGCGACVAACPNGAGMLFAGAKVSQLAALPQGQVEAAERVAAMVKAMADNGFGNCSNHYECQAACPKGVDVKFIARLNREFLKALAQEKVGALQKAAG